MRFLSLLFWALGGFGAMLVLLSSGTFAAGVSDLSPFVTPPPEVVTIEGSSAREKIEHIFFVVVNFLLYLSGVGATGAIVIAGIRLTFSAGSEGQIEGAKQMLLYAVLGLLAVLLSLFVVKNIVWFLSIP